MVWLGIFVIFRWSPRLITIKAIKTYFSYAKVSTWFWVTISIFCKERMGSSYIVLAKKFNTHYVFFQGFLFLQKFYMYHPSNSTSRFGFTKYFVYNIILFQYLCFAVIPTAKIGLLILFILSLLKNLIMINLGAGFSLRALFIEILYVSPNN